MLTNLDNPERLASNYKGELVRMPCPKGKLLACYVAGLVELWGNGKSFAVVYGLQCQEGLDYAEAAKELGLSIMHALACDGLIK